MERKELKEKIIEAINSFKEKDEYLLKINANKRSITYKFAEHLSKIFNHDWDVDCEYNRDGYEPKRIGLSVKDIQSDDLEGHTVYPDIIIHRRREEGESDNLLVIEVKKFSATKEAKEDDIRKIKIIKEKFNYQFGIFLELYIERPANIKFRFIE